MKFFSLPNLSSHDAALCDPLMMIPVASYPSSKEKFREWCASKARKPKQSLSITETLVHICKCVTEFLVVFDIDKMLDVRRVDSRVSVILTKDANRGPRRNTSRRRYQFYAGPSRRLSGSAKA